MDLDKNNFFVLLDQIKGDILNCDFITVDCEYSGIFTWIKKFSIKKNYKYISINSQQAYKHI